MGETQTQGLKTALNSIGGNSALDSVPDHLDPRVNKPYGDGPYENTLNYYPC
jgi:hypothetical protein